MTAVDTRQHRHPHVTEHRHPPLLPTISEESRSSSPRQSKPDWPWDSDDEEYIENAPPQTDAHARLGWEIAEYRERRHLGDSDAPDDELYAVPAETLPNVRTPTILVTPPPARPRISPFEWDSPSPRFEPGLQFGEWGDWGQSAGGSRGLSPNLEAVSPRSAKFDLSAPLCGEGMPSLATPLRSSHERRFSNPSLRQPRFSDPDEWYSCHSSGGSFGMLDVQRRSVDVQAIACWRLDVFEECGGWPGRAAPVGVLESYGGSAVKGEGVTGRIGGEEGSVRAKGVRE
ncbi:hypothetical protein CcaverHIS002_0102060 [Cutaneotrichosporon cavernicola]|uniref:Uncharacterized protein n=1 Tax=Cutaneotrichosporon cavernicola TaxID=279322 RepID=A0AA48IHS6_9TREE|nr:uncharacterized protein CcaverHIS019_0102010 [Cutaneotrichosporon cavernicola]BEI79677.1 hypothetical protein CcaverHIS002_0102060 [Cutaneotrichosporon cavernicola]BEI87483.1 hypothetical protein CcaverHIS019_0102010 [Cutaneotrichosporon cavernicola]BEI95254.1 hypothetical protein CcaverHIS631_0102030 [Cutaneotrichosporon cavernicola]BEJ03027.1 hypothetical protein CcaverHIS641_0102020 [Cutaneotrichosporon cavernicola]